MWRLSRRLHWRETNHEAHRAAVKAVSLPARGHSFHSSPQHWPPRLLSALLSNSWQMQSRSLVRTPQRLSLRAPECTKSPFRGAKTGSSHTTCFLKQHVLILLLQHVQDMRHETRDEFLNFYRTADNFREKKEAGGETPCFHWGWKIMRPLFLPMFSSSCYKLRATRTSTWPIKQLKNEQTRKILRGVFHISQGEGCHLLCK